MNYYDKELQRIIDERSEYPISIQIHGENVKTKYLSLNIESIESLRAFLDIVEDDFRK